MDNKTLSDLIGLIYDTAQDIKYWPRLLEMLSDELGAIINEKTEPDSVSKNGLIALLRAHITRAVALKCETLETHKAQNTLLALLDRLPLGMMVVDSESHVSTFNRRLESILSSDRGICISNKKIGGGTSRDTIRLRALIRTVAESEDSRGETILLSSPSTNMPLSAFIVPLTANQLLKNIDKNKVAVLIAAPEMHVDISTDTLQSIYRLTRAEAKLVSSLVQDLNLNAIAEKFGVSKHTIRNQLKSIYEKTGTHRQAELVKQVVTGPAMLATLTGIDSPIDFSPTSIQPRRVSRSESRTHLTVRLSDGRVLGYAEYGAPDGRPVMLMHAANGSRLERHPDHTIAERCGVRLIIPDRPGVGLSHANQNATLLSWACDIDRLADSLKLKSFGIIGHSIGSAFGLACAHRLKNRIFRQVIVAGIAPFDSVWELEGMYAPLRLLFFCGKFAHPLLEPLLGLFHVQITADAYQRQLWRNLAPVDRALIRDKKIRDRLMENAEEAFRQDNHSIFPETLMVSKHWGFDICDIEVPSDIWHGEMDRVVPLKMARTIAETLPRSRTHFLPDAGHCLLFHCWRDILKCVIAKDEKTVAIDDMNTA